jgi:polyisoprenoid-binding protein YceI
MRRPVGLPHDEVLRTRERLADFFEVDQYPTMTFTSLFQNQEVNKY